MHNSQRASTHAAELATHPKLQRSSHSRKLASDCQCRNIPPRAHCPSADSPAVRRAPRLNGPAALARSATAEPTELRAPTCCGAAPKMLIAVRVCGRAGATAKTDDDNADTAVEEVNDDDDVDSATRTKSHCDVDVAPTTAVCEPKRACAAATDTCADGDDDTDDDDCACLPICDALERCPAAAGTANDAAADAFTAGVDRNNADAVATATIAAADGDDDEDNDGNDDNADNEFEEAAT